MNSSLVASDCCALLLLCASPAFGQGTIQFNNRVTNTGAVGGPVISPIFGVEPSAPTLRKTGNPATYPLAPIPVGTQTYGGAPLVGTNYTASLWAAFATDPDEQLRLIATTPFRTTTSETLMGFWQPPPTAVVVPFIRGSSSDTNDWGKFQVRVWDNRNGTITSWQQLDQPGFEDVPRGFSDTFVVPFPLGGGTTFAPSLAGLQSFNLFTLTVPIRVSISGEGAVSKSPDKPDYAIGEEVTLTATPNVWYQFNRWGDGITNNPRTITVGVSNNYSAIFYSTAAVETLIYGGVKRIAPIGAPAIFVDGEFVIASNVSRVSHAEIAVESTFTNGTIFYTLDGSPPDASSSIYSAPFTIYRNRTIRAIAYDETVTKTAEADPVRVTIIPIIPTYSVLASTAGGGSVSVSPGDVKIASNTIVTLTATPVAGWSFLNWLGGVSSTNPTETLLVTKNECVEAVFGTMITTSVNGNGGLLIEPQAAIYPYGWNFTARAVPDARNAFAVWGNGRGTNNPLRLQVTPANLTLSALFGASPAGQYTLAVRPSGAGDVTLTPFANRYTNAQTVVLTAVPRSDGEFLGWGGQAGGIQNPLSVTVNRDLVVTASFTKAPVTIAIWGCVGRTDANPAHALISSDLRDVLTWESSSNLFDWARVLDFTNSYGRTQFDLPASEPSQFYRARLHLQP